MGLSDYKINSFSKPVSALDDTPKMSASELKEWFDSNSTNELKKSVNGIIDELKDVDVNKQHTHDNKDILDAINEEVTQFELSKQHTHENKDILDDISADTYATKEELAASKKWKTLLDVTLTEEQAGVSSIMLAIEDIMSLAKAKQVRIAMSFPVAEEKAANAFWTSIKLQNSSGSGYSNTILSGYNKKGSANAIYHTIASINVLDFIYNSKSIYQNTTMHSVFQLPNPHYDASANTNATASEATGSFPSDLMQVKGYEPYLAISTGAVTMEAGTHIFMEVCD